MLIVACVKVNVHGVENIPKDNEYIVCPNHLSTLDPPMICGVWPRRISFMAKKELFEGDSFLAKYITRNVSRLGAFAVNREKLEVATIKSTKEVFKANK